MTKAQLVSDIILRISSGKPSDDLELEPKQVAFWIDQVLNAVVKNSLDQRIINKEGVDSEYILYEPNLIVSTTITNGKSIYYIDLDNEPMNLYRDGGIIRILNSNGLNVVDKARAIDLDILKELKFSKPSLKNIQYTRVKSRIYFQGLDTNYAQNNFDIWYVPKTKVLEKLQDTDNIYVAEDLIPIIADQVTKLAYYEVVNQSGDTTNDGTQDNTQPTKYQPQR